MSSNVADLFEAPKLPKMDLVPPQDAEVEGVFRPGKGHPFHNRIIYTQRVIDRAATLKTKRIKRDAQGNELWKKHATTGEPIYPIMEMDVVYKTDRYILNAQERARNVKKVRNFEMTAEERAHLERKDAEANFFREFVQAAVAEGLTAAEVLRRMKQDIAPGAPEDALDIGVTERAVQEVAAQIAPDVLKRPEEEDAVAVPPKKRVGRPRREVPAE